MYDLSGVPQDDVQRPTAERMPTRHCGSIVAPRDVFRLVRTNPPTDDDFRSQRAEKPTVRFNVSECRARGLSVFVDRLVAERIAKKPNLIGTAICQVVLTTGAGRIKQTSGRSHYTWWPYKDYDILANCQMVDL